MMSLYGAYGEVDFQYISDSWETTSTGQRIDMDFYGVTGYTNENQTYGSYGVLGLGAQNPS